MAKSKSPVKAKKKAVSNKGKKRVAKLGLI